MKKCFALCLALVMALCCFPAFAEDAPFGLLAERGVSLPMTQEDVEMGLNLSYALSQTPDGQKLPVFDVIYADLEAIEAVVNAYEGQNMEDPEVFYAMLSEMLVNYHNLFEVALFESDYYAQMAASGLDYAAYYGDAVVEMGENCGYTYIAIDVTDALTYTSEEQRQKIVAAAVRARELIENASFVELVFPAEEQTAMSGAFPAFSTTDLAGNPVTEAIFSGKDLTVVNVWGTYCSPCIDEMPDLAAWSAEMPENVQLIGIVCDLASLEDAETLAAANDICEATGANAYVSLVANESLMPLLQTVVGVPTTFFVDGAGQFVGDAIVGANVPGCQAFVESYLSAL